MSGDRRIQQQYYTRGREGVFRSSEGFDTVAVSPGLDLTFIKSTLQPYCVYKAPKELAERSEEDASHYPAPLTVFHAKGGDLVIGRSVYVAVDFTGQRSASFTHQFVVPAERKEAFIREPNRLFRVQGFQERYDESGSKELPELDEIAYDQAFDAAEADRLLQKLGIGDVRFRELIHAIWVAVSGKRKVYISLGSAAREAAEDAQRLLEIVYRCLPYPVRRRLGFTTFSIEAESKQHLHLVFVERGGIRSSDRSSDKDFVFDFASDRYANTELPEPESAFLTEMWELRTKPERLADLFDFCEEAWPGANQAGAGGGGSGGDGIGGTGSGVGGVGGTGRGRDGIGGTGSGGRGGEGMPMLAEYDTLVQLYRMEQGDLGAYADNRNRTMHVLADCLAAHSAQGAKRLNGLLIRLLREDAAKPDLVPDADFVRSLARCYEAAEDGPKALALQCFLMFIKRAAAAVTGGIWRAAELIDAIRERPALFASVFGELRASGRDKDTAEAYIAHCIGRSSSAAALLKEIDAWLAYGGAELFQPAFANEVLKKCDALLKSDRSKRWTGAQALIEYFDRLPEREQNRDYEDICGQLKLELCQRLLSLVDIGELGLDELLRVGALLTANGEELWRSADRMTAQKLELLEIVYNVLSGEKEPSAVKETLDRLGPLDLQRVRDHIKRMLQDRIDRSQFGKLPYAFYDPQPGSAGYASDYDYFALLQFIRMAAGAETVYDFLVWSAGDARFARNQGIDPNYRAAIGKYFDLLDAKAFRQKAVREQLLSVGNEAFAALFGSIKRKQTGLSRFISVVRLLASVSSAAAGAASRGQAGGKSGGKARGKTAAKASGNAGGGKASARVSGGKASARVSSGQAAARPDRVSSAAGWPARRRRIVRLALLLVMAVILVMLVRIPVSYWIESSKPPVLTVDTLPETVDSPVLRLKASVPEGDLSVRLYVNGEYVSNGTMDKPVTLQTGVNRFEFKAVDRKGKESEPVVKQVTYTPKGPKLEIGEVPETTQSSSLKVTFSAADPSDPSPKLFVNGKQVGKGSVTTTITLSKGDNRIEFAAENKDGERGEPVVKTVRYEIEPTGTSGTSGGESGSSGGSGTSGTSGSAGTSGASGTSGGSGTSGTTGTSGASGTSRTSGSGGGE